MDKQQLQTILEAAILAAGHPLSIDKLLTLFTEEERPGKDEIRAALQAVAAATAGRGFELKEVASGYRFQVKQELAPWVNRLWEEKPQKYSRALLETLALIAYRQPITRGDIEEIRGVAVSSHITKTLLEREWIRVVGHRDVPGRPALYATTRQFLDYFNLKSLEELPSLAEIRDIDKLNEELDLSDRPADQDPDGGLEEDAKAPQEQSSTAAEVAEEQEQDSAALAEPAPSPGDSADDEISPQPEGNPPQHSDPAASLGDIAARFISRTDDGQQQPRAETELSEY